MVEEVLIEAGHLFRGRTVHEHRVEDVHADDLAFQGGDVAVLQLFAVVAQVDAVTIEDGLLRRGNAHHVEFQLASLLERLVLRANLFDEVAANGSYATDEEVQHLIFRQEERVVEYVERLAQVLAIDHERDVGLRGTLCAGNDTDARASQRAKQFTGDARGVLHVLTYNSDGG